LKKEDAKLCMPIIRRRLKLNLYLCVQQDIAYMVQSGLWEFNDSITVKPIYNVSEFLRSFSEESDALLFVDQYIGEESTIEKLTAIKKRLPGVKILLVVSDNTAKMEIALIIMSKIVSAILVRPFSIEQLTTNLYKLLGK
jgi:DNA-binding NtrC family response regulator